MPSLRTHNIKTPAYNGTITFNTQLFINGEWVDPIDKETIDVINPTTGTTITQVSIGSSKDIDLAVAVAKNAYETTWGLHCPGAMRGSLLRKLADLVEQHAEELAVLEALDVGKPLASIKAFDVPVAINLLRYYAGWADKIMGKVIETNEQKVTYTRREPYGVVGSIIPWNFPLLLGIAKLAPALATGNTLIWKPSEIAPLATLKFVNLVKEAGFPPGVVNLVTGFGPSVGRALASHLGVDKLSFTGSTQVGREVMRAAADSNLKDVTLELGGKGATIIFGDADLEQAVRWAVHGISFGNGQACIAGSRIYVQDAIYDVFLTQFTEAVREIAADTGDPFAPGTRLGPVVSQVQFDRVMDYIDSGEAEGATIHLGGARHGTEGYFIQPTIFTDVTPNMRIMREEIFGPVCTVVKFHNEEEVIFASNDTTYGLGNSVFSKNIDTSLRVAHAMEAGMVWVNLAVVPEVGVTFGGYKQSGVGREWGEEAIDTYTRIKAVHINLGTRL